MMIAISSSGKCPATQMTAWGSAETQTWHVRPPRATISSAAPRIAMYSSSRIAERGKIGLCNTICHPCLVSGRGASQPIITVVAKTASPRKTATTPTSGGIHQRPSVDNGSSKLTYITNTLRQTQHSIRSISAPRTPQLAARL